MKAGDTNRMACGGAVALTTIRGKFGTEAAALAVFHNRMSGTVSLAPDRASIVLDPAGVRVLAITLVEAALMASRAARASEIDWRPKNAAFCAAITAITASKAQQARAALTPLKPLRLRRAHPCKR